VLSLFARDPFAGGKPQTVRAVLWQYWFTDRRTRAATGAWWRRQEIGLYAPALDQGSALKGLEGVEGGGVGAEDDSVP
jgi:hypothetical protein